MPTSTLTIDDIEIKPDVRLIGLPEEQAAKSALTGAADEVLKSILTMLRAMVRDVISSRTEADFRARFRSVFPGYFNLVVAFGKVASAAIPHDKVVQMARESFSELESEIRTKGHTTFGEQMTERAMFTVWTLRKISDLLEQVTSQPAPDPHREKDVQLAGEYFGAALIARFHVDCLVGFMRTGAPFYPDVEPAIDEGLRAAVNAYACIKQSVDMRFPSSEDDLADAPWTSEQQEWLDDSARDFFSET